RAREWPGLREQGSSRSQIRAGWDSVGVPERISYSVLLASLVRRTTTIRGSLLNASPASAAPPAADPNALDRGTMIVAAVVLLGAVMSILDTTVINVAIDQLATDFNASLTTIQWVVTGYTLALAAV